MVEQVIESPEFSLWVRRMKEACMATGVKGWQVGSVRASGSREI